MVETRPNLFLISPIGRGGSPARRQANAVKDFVADATESSYKVVRGDDQPHARIADSILDALQRHPIVVAYLGSEKTGGWNPNVMFEVGYRLATSKPMVLLAHEDESVPFDLRDYRHVPIPPVERLPYDRLAPEYEVHKKLLLDEIQRRTLHRGLKSPFAIADFFIDTTRDRPDRDRELNSIFLRASEKADRLFHTAKLFPEDGTLVGKRLTEVDARLGELIDAHQLDEFREEQERLFGRLLLRKPNIVATVPFIFKDEGVEPEFQRRAFLPLITDYDFKENGLAIRVLYQEVPNTLVKLTTDGVFKVAAADSRAFLSKLRVASPPPSSNGEVPA